MHNFIHHIKSALSAIYDKQESQSILSLIIQHATGQSLPVLLSDKNKKITPVQKQNIQEILERLQNNEPIQYIIGETEFFGLPFVVNPDVLIPRPETEELVESIINNNHYATPRILDIGTGSGSIAVSLKKHIPNAYVEAWDFSEKALNVAETNAEINKTRIEFRKVDILKEYPANNIFDIIVSNPPYVLESEKKDMNHNVLDFEPHSALFVPDDNPLLFYERIADISKGLFKKKGCLYLEINQGKGIETIKLLEEKGFSDIRLIKDMSGNDRMVKAEFKNKI